MEQKSVVKLLQTKESLYVFDAAAENNYTLCLCTAVHSVNKKII